ncbi:MAG: hypothetical protein KKC14_03025, partial [Alphaproteobacteria bacterium]|nr:hypothetical protein [Alphaproteobacteria bacterium]
GDLCRGLSGAGQRRYSDSGDDDYRLHVRSLEFLARTDTSGARRSEVNSRTCVSLHKFNHSLIRSAAIVVILSLTIRNNSTPRFTGCKPLAL